MKGIIRIAAATPRLHLGDPRANVTELVRLASAVSADGAAAIVFPELCLTGYTCGDLFFRSDLLSAAESALADFAAATAKLPIIAIVGFPQREGDLIRNAAAVVYGGAIVGVVCKRILPTYAEYYERRQFTPAPSDEPLKVFDAGSFRFGVEICEDLWTPVPPSARMASRGVDVIFNLSASTDFLGKSLRRQDMVRQQSARLVCAYAMACAGTGESSADAVFGGGSLIAVNGAVATASKLFCADSSLVMTDVDIESLRFRRRSESSHQEQVDLPPPHLVPLAAELPSATPRAVSPSPFLDEYGEEGWHRKILTIQATALARRMESAHVRKLVIGVSGGADSALALLGAAAALDRQGLPRNHLLAVVMPGFGSTGRTQGTAAALSRAVGATLRTVDICAACHRIANMENALVVGTGDLSEIALGWNTYSGDHMSMYQLNCSVPKTMVLGALRNVAAESDEPLRTLLTGIADSPITPELVPNAAANDSEARLGPYELHDFFLFHYLANGADAEKLLTLARIAFKESYSDETLVKTRDTFLRRFRQSQYKRNCVPDGPKITLSLSPRADWRMPSDS